MYGTLPSCGKALLCGRCQSKIVLLEGIFVGSCSLMFAFYYSVNCQFGSPATFVIRERLSSPVPVQTGR